MESDVAPVGTPLPNGNSADTVLAVSAGASKVKTLLSVADTVAIVKLTSRADP
jgi:hypothetical protein